MRPTKPTFRRLAEDTMAGTGDLAFLQRLSKTIFVSFYIINARQFEAAEITITTLPETSR